LRQEQILSLQTILDGALESESAFADLVYVLETLAETQLAPEEEILPVYGMLMPLRKRSGTEVLEGLQGIQARLRERFLSVLTAEPIPESNVH
jgi:hypothetical protein